jgi:prolyl oligopeptidase
MTHGNFIRKLFNKLAGKPDSRFEINLSFEDRYSAGNPPMDNDIVDTFHGVRVSDPFRPLENLDSYATNAWVNKQNDKFAQYISDKQDVIEKTTAFLQDAMNYDSFSLPSQYGDRYFRTFHKALAAQSVIETATSEKGPWTVLLDPNLLNQNGTTALSDWTPSADGKRVVIMLSESGSDVQTLKILNTESGKFLDDKIENCRFTSVLWDKDSSDSFLYTYPAHDGSRRTTVMHHVIGKAKDTTVFAPEEENSFPSPARLKTAKYEWMYHSIGTDNNSGLYYRPSGSTADFTQLVAPQTYNLCPIAELDDGSVLATTNLDAPRGRLVKFYPADPAPERWLNIIPQHDEDLLDGVMFHQNRLFAFYAHDTADAIRVHDADGKHLHDVPLPTQSIASFARVNKDDKILKLKISGFQSAGDFYAYDIETNTLTMTAKGPAKYDLNDCIVERIHATSKDGTKIPMTVIRHPDTVLDGTAAVKLYGYGGFNVPLTPGFSSTVMHFVRAGGIYVQANLRGGGEYGDDWYNGGRLQNKQNVFDDFIACAKHLIAGKYTCPDRLVINGGSNGGLLTSATVLQRPDLFGAVVTEVPVTDMFRFHLATYGSAWKSDYGDPSVKEDFNAAAKYSPLHNVKKGVKYPPHLIKTADHDDRVVPWHSYKLAATLMALDRKDNIILLRVQKDAGHGAGMPTDKRIQDQAETFAFIEKSIGPINQNELKAKIAAEQEAEKNARQARRNRPFREKIKDLGRKLKNLYPRDPEF